MLAYVYSTLRENSALVSLVDTRIYRHGSAPENVTKPYITWFVVAGLPDVNLSDSPYSDNQTIQIDCWSDTDAQVESIATAVRDALDSAKIVSRINQNNREDETRLYRIGIEADFIFARS